MMTLSGLLAALASGVAFALYQITIKRLHGAVGTLHPLAIPAWLGLLAPFWLAVFMATQGEGAYVLTPEALRWPLAWAACSMLSTTGLVWLLRSFSLSEVAGYKKALITLGALGMDIALFGLHFPLFTLLAIALLLGGALGLSSARNRIPSKAEWLVIALWCAVLVVQITLYKYGQRLQPSVLAHTVLAQLFVTVGYALLWLLPAIRRQATGGMVPPLRLIAALWACMLAGTLLEGFAYAGLPLALVLVVTMLPAALMAAHDLWRGDLPRTPKAWLALGALAAGFMALMLGK